MKIEERFHYDADPETVLAMLLDPEFQRAKSEDGGAISYNVDIVDRVVTVQRTMPTDGIPDIVRRLVGRTVDITERSVYRPAAADGSISSELTLSFAGQPMTFRGSVTLTPAGGTTDGRFAGELKASVPLIGGKIEKASAPQIVAGVRSEVATGQSYLGERA